MNRKRLLDAARGIYRPAASSVHSEHSYRPLPCFKLRCDHVSDALSIESPDRFHDVLCRMIRGAKNRVYLASLYIGPAASNKHVREHELLDALRFAASDANRDTSNNVHVKILMDKNRALRPVPLGKESTNNKQQHTTSSAEAVNEAIRSEDDNNEGSIRGRNKVYLFSVLPPILQHILPNPFNEIAGVFHMKAYIIDDCLLMSGANLSEEYFCDRHDRYLLIRNGGAGLVEFYAELVNILCDHAELYNNVANHHQGHSHNPTTRTELLQSLNKLFASSENNNLQKITSDLENNCGTVAYVVPTFQTPKYFFSEKSLQFLSDIQASQSLLQTALEQKSPSIEIRISTAYLNLTESMTKLCSGFQRIKLITAGSISHGFAPRKKAGNKGVPWIPTIFAYLSKEASRKLKSELWYYERPGWTFHAKGLWIMESNQQQKNLNVVAVVCGSSNFGARSESIDLESNCFLFLPKQASKFEGQFQREWQHILDHSKLYMHSTADDSNESVQERIDDVSHRTKDDPATASIEKQPNPLSWWQRVLLPACRKLF